MPDTNAILRYLKVRALADKGSDGERANARVILTRMEENIPGIHDAAEQYLQTHGASPTTATAPPGVWPKNGERTTGFPFPFPGNWENLFSWAEAALQGAYGFAESVANVAAAHQLSALVDSSTRGTRAGNLLITLKMNYLTYQKALHLNPLQRQAFKQALHAKLSEELDKLLPD